MKTLLCDLQAKRKVHREKKGSIVVLQAFYRFGNLGNVKMLSTK